MKGESAGCTVTSHKNISFEREGKKMEEMKEQLLSMGFPEHIVAQALAATGNNSTLQATEWILKNSNQNPSQTDSEPSQHHTHTHSQSPPSDSSTQSPSPPFQPKINRFFHSQSKQSPPAIPTSHFQEIVEGENELHPKKRHKPIFLFPGDVKKERQTISNQQPGPLAEVQELNPTKCLKPILSTNSSQQSEPLAERMRPRSINEVVGQDHLLANRNSILCSAIDCNRLPSIILWGPPGTGKTSIAKAIASSTSSTYRFVSLSAVSSGVKDVREVVDEARKQKLKNKKRTVLFVDEVHRFNKSQQDSFLPVIEDGSITFIGATTENPSFHLITPLLSRCRVLTVNPLKPNHIVTLLNRAALDSEKGLIRSVARENGILRFEVKDEAFEFLATNCDGDARVALNALEISAIAAASHLAIASQTPNNDAVEDFNNGNVELVATITLDDAKEAMQSKHLAYDKAGEEHYNLISALHKSMRGGDADAAIYWLVRMLEGGEQPLYIARRLIRFASEDVGLADPSALSQAVACYQACHFIGMPECNVILAQCASYLALAPKSIAVYQAMEAAQKVVRESVGQNEGVPLHLRNAPTKLMKDLGYGKDYIYTPTNPALSSSQTYLPPSLQGYKFLHWPNNASTNH